MYPDVVVHIKDCVNGTTLPWQMAMVLMKELLYDNSSVLDSL